MGGHVLLQCMHACTLSRFSRVRLCETLWTGARQAPLSTGFSRQEYWSGLPFSPPPKPWASFKAEYTLVPNTTINDCSETELMNENAGNQAVS